MDVLQRCREGERDRETDKKRKKYRNNFGGEESQRGSNPLRKCNAFSFPLM